MLIVNLYGGPGCGKSTLAAATFAVLKQRQVSAELVTEFAKECAWEGREGPLRCQPYVFGQQMWRIERLRGRGVDVVVSDSPILLSAVYAPVGTPPAFKEAVQAYARGQKAMSVWVRRVKAYDPRGRFQNENEAMALDDQIERAVYWFDHEVDGDARSAEYLASRIQTRLATQGTTP